MIPPGLGYAELAGLWSVRRQVEGRRTAATSAAMMSAFSKGTRS